MPKRPVNIPKGAQGYAEFHEKLEKIIEENWGITPQFTNPFSWGYSSTGIYVKDVNQKEYVGMLAENTPSKRAAMEKNFTIASKLNLSVRVPEQLKTKDGKFLLDIPRIEIKSGKDVENKLLSLGNFLSGIPPFDMNEDITLQAVNILREIHQVNPNSLGIRLDTIECEKPKFLHGDLTPSNILVGYGKIIAVLDFELSLIGPVEYDLARLAVFSWFRIQDSSFIVLLEKVQEEYGTEGATETSMELMKEFALLHCQKHLNNVKQHKDVYETEKAYKADLLFTERQLETLKADLAQIPNPVL